VKNFFAHVIALTLRAPNGCWLFAGPRDHNGYGVISRKEEGHTKTRMAHRIVYEGLKGVIPTGLQLDHLCRCRWCVNPEHLEAVTAYENTMRSRSPAAINARKTHCVKGHELSGDNVFFVEGWRRCRACSRVSSKKTTTRAYRKRQADKPSCDMIAAMTGVRCTRKARFTQGEQNRCGLHLGLPHKKNRVEGAILKMAEESR
jgi:hypothetical protein